MSLPGLAPETSSGPDINLFVLKEGRLPRLGDGVHPWLYRGWLLWQVQLADHHPMLPHRWDHYMRTLEAGHLLDEAIPEIRFEECPATGGRRMIDRCLGFISHRESPWSAFNRFVDWLAWGLAVSREMPEFDETTQESLYRTFNLEPLLLEPHDYLGTILAEHRTGGWNPHAFFPTPHNVTECMVQMTRGDSTQNSAKDPRLQTILDPCVGTGRMLLHASNFSYCLYGCDIDPLVAMITRINSALYAPWLAFPFSKGVLGRPLPPPPPAPLPLPEEAIPSGGETLFRCDDRGQGLLFS
jgi:hypothetical protein